MAHMQHVSNPTQAWSVLESTQRVETVRVQDPSAPKPAGHTRFVCISDTHGLTDELVIPDGDVLLHGGDFSNTGELKDIQKFDAFLARLPHQHKIVIAGNHDLTFDSENYTSLWKRYHRQPEDHALCKGTLKSCTYLEDSGTEVNGLTIWGSPWQPEFCNWGFNVPRGQLQKYWEKIPAGVDVLMTHGPPLGHGDTLHPSGGKSGCLELLLEIQNRIRPRYHLFGHIHEGYGVTTDGQTTYVNASTCTFKYKPTNPAIVFDLPNRC